jgi:hypothetical protein
MLRAFTRSVALLVLPASLAAQGQVVGPAGGGSVTTVTPNAISSDLTPWHVTRQGAGTAEVTTTRPCGLETAGSPCGGGFGGVGSGSLELAVTGNTVGGEYPDWAFWYLYAGGADNQQTNFGNLQQLSSLSFDWFRYEAENSGWDALPPVGETPINPVDWRWKTPVLRLQLLERHADGSTVRSELVWEGFYNQARIAAHGAPNGYTPINRWVTQDGINNDAFWYVRIPGEGGVAGYSVNETCGLPMSFWAGGITSSSVGGLFGSGGCFEGASVDVLGIAIGVGSQWPLPYHGFVDNLRMGFDGQEGYAVNTNWDFVSTVPEPASAVLLLVGLGALAARSRRR